MGLRSMRHLYHTIDVVLAHIKRDSWKKLGKLICITSV